VPGPGEPGRVAGLGQDAGGADCGQAVIEAVYCTAGDQEAVIL
jgi:hypothetical protein